MDDSAKETLKELLDKEEYTEEDAKKVMDSIGDMLKDDINTATSPVSKINFSFETTYGVTGMYLMTLVHPTEFINQFADRNGLTDSTWLWFTARHVMEMCQALYCAADLLISYECTTRERRDILIQRIVSAATPRPYESFMDAIEQTLYELQVHPKVPTINRDPMKRKICANYMEIAKTLWFVPYSKVDEISNILLQIKSQKAGDSDERSDNQTVE